jgi:hypothetical protein
MPQAHGAQGDEVIFASTVFPGGVPSWVSTSRVGGGELCTPEPERGRVWEASEGSEDQGSEDRVGGAGLCPAEPERGRVWEEKGLGRLPFPSHHNRAVALMVEQRSPKPRVVGSSPACPAHARVGLAGLSLVKPARGKVWRGRAERGGGRACSGGRARSKPSRDFHLNVGA